MTTVLLIILSVIAYLYRKELKIWLRNYIVPSEPELYFCPMHTRDPMYPRNPISEDSETFSETSLETPSETDQP